ncbi:MAG: diguanylate cyclase [Chitinivibrionales bacterium]|nr:diguanylate cyclase [Chitinivibrionales bacterium]
MEKSKKYTEVNLQELEKELDSTNLKIDDIQNLKKLTESQAIELAGGDLLEHIEKDEEILLSLDKQPGTYHQDIIFALIQIRLPENEAQRDWKEILKHKYDISQKLGRNVGIHVAALDYYTNIKRKIKHPKIIDANEYADTASRALADDLTKAYNRQFFEQQIKRLFFKAKTGGNLFSMLMLDLDHFKMYNDLNGHIKGDIALIETVRILHAVCSTDDTVARYGGEEFSILLPNQSLSLAMTTADNIRNALYDYRFVNEQHLPGGRLSVSIGVTAFRDDIKEPSEMIDEADVALYRAKNSGRNKVKAFFRESAS